MTDDQPFRTRDYDEGVATTKGILVGLAIMIPLYVAAILYFFPC